MKGGAFNNPDAGDVDDLFEAGGVPLEKGKLFAGCGDFQFSLETLADELGLAGLFEDAESFFPDSEDFLPLFEQRGGVLGEDFFRLGELREVDAGFAAV